MMPVVTVTVMESRPMSILTRVRRMRSCVALASF